MRPSFGGLTVLWPYLATVAASIIASIAASVETISTPAQRAAPATLREL
ncbi:hypothetical protein MAUB1S_03990 [Mycolicibacterium aubagnense]